MGVHAMAFFLPKIVARKIELCVKLMLCKMTVISGNNVAGF